MKEFSYEEIEAATGGFAAKNVVGKGSHGCVYRARLSTGGRRLTTVAVKKASHPQGEAKLANEIAVLLAARHPGVVNLVGVAAAAAADGPRAAPLLVMEYMPNGSLHELLHLSPKPPPWPRRVAIALNVARAVRALHGGEPRVIHRDLKSANILLDGDGRARLADFSLAVRVSADAAPAPLPAGTIGYLDPCYTEPGRLGPASDVFSFGVVLLELLSGRKVMDVRASPSSVVSWAAPLIAAGKAGKVLDKRLPAPPGAEAELAVARVLALAARCVSETVERRPTMAEVCSELRGALESAGWWRHGSVARMVYRRVVSWGRHLHVKRRRARTSKIECTELSGSDGSGGAHDRADSCPLSSRSNSMDSVSVYSEFRFR